MRPDGIKFIWQKLQVFCYFRNNALSDSTVTRLCVPLLTGQRLVYFLFDRVDSIYYLTRIRHKEWSNVSVPRFVFYKIDVTLKRQLRKLHVSTGTAAVLTRIIYNWITQQVGYLKRVIVTPILSL